MLRGRTSFLLGKYAGIVATSAVFIAIMGAVLLFVTAIQAGASPTLVIGVPVALLLLAAALRDEIQDIRLRVLEEDASVAVLKEAEKAAGDAKRSTPTAKPSERAAARKAGERRGRADRHRGSFRPGHLG